MYDDAIIGCTSISEESNNILDLRRFRTIITDFEEIISFGDERAIATVFVQECEDRVIQRSDMISTCSTNIELESHPHVPIIGIFCCHGYIVYLTFYFRRRDTHVFHSHEEIFESRFVRECIFYWTRYDVFYSDILS